MIQSRAHSVLADFRANIARIGYDQTDKRHISALFADLKYMFQDPKQSYDMPKYKAVSDLQMQWNKDRMNATGGADTIAEILCKLESYIPDLPVEVKDTTITIPSRDEQDADRILAVFKQRGVKISALGT